MKLLVIVDMQNDFIDGSLANPAAQSIVKPMADYIKNFTGVVIYTYDTHYADYLETREGQNLPIKHCIYGTKGWKYNKEIRQAICANPNIKIAKVTKQSFSARGDDFIDAIFYCYQDIEEIQLCGTCTDICVIANALSLINIFPRAKIVVLKDLCAGLTLEKHEAALEVMRSCQIEVV